MVRLFLTTIFLDSLDFVVRQTGVSEYEGESHVEGGGQRHEGSGVWFRVTEERRRVFGSQEDEPLMVFEGIECSEVDFHREVGIESSCRSSYQGIVYENLPRPITIYLFNLFN